MSVRPRSNACPSDALARLVTMAGKGGVLLVPVPPTRRAALVALLEALSQAYRFLAPVPVWYAYFAGKDALALPLRVACFAVCLLAKIATLPPPRALLGSVRAACGAHAAPAYGSYVAAPPVPVPLAGVSDSADGRTGGAGGLAEGDAAAACPICLLPPTTPLRLACSVRRFRGLACGAHRLGPAARVLRGLRGAVAGARALVSALPRQSAARCARAFGERLYETCRSYIYTLYLQWRSPFGGRARPTSSFSSCK